LQIRFFWFSVVVKMLLGWQREDVEMREGNKRQKIGLSCNDNIIPFS